MKSKLQTKFNEMVEDLEDDAKEGVARECRRLRLALAAGATAAVFACGGAIQAMDNENGARATTLAIATIAALAAPWCKNTRAEWLWWAVPPAVAGLLIGL